MWEFSLNLKTENFSIAKDVFLRLQNEFKNFSGVVTSSDDGQYIKILIATENQNRDFFAQKIENCIANVICVNFKEIFLNENLYLPLKDNMGKLAFKKALLNFDKETDNFIVKRNLDIKNELFLESFYFFRLKYLRDKWQELVDLSNENKDFLMTNDSFVDLLKFLVDNLEIYQDEIYVLKSGNSYKILFNDKTVAFDNLDEDDIVSSVIDLSPKKINLFFNESSGAIKLLKDIFDSRVIEKSLNENKIRKININ